MAIMVAAAADSWLSYDDSSSDFSTRRTETRCLHYTHISMLLEIFMFATTAYFRLCSSIRMACVDDETIVEPTTT
jgi:hypothetical protein